MNLKLYGYWRSSASWRIRWALKVKKIPYDYIPVNILKEEHREPTHLSRVPMGTLPVIEIEPRNFLSQSLPIMLWIEETFSSEPYLFSKDRTYRYKILELCELINSDTAPLQTPRAQKAYSEQPEGKAAWAKGFIIKGLSAFQTLIGNSGGKYCLGDNLTAADLFLIPQMYNARRFGIDPEKEFPKLHSIYEHCTQLPECVDSSPDKQCDAVKA